MRRILLAAAVAALAAAPAAHGEDFAFTDWTAAVENSSATGTLLGQPITLAGDFISPSPSSSLDGSWSFASSAFTPAIARSDEIQLGITALASKSDYTLQFGAPVTDPRFLLSSLGETMTFHGVAGVERLSGDPDFVVSGDAVTGRTVNGVDTDGTIEIAGTYSALSFTISHVAPSTLDGVPMTVVAPVPTATPTPVPLPSPPVIPPPAPQLPPVAPPVSGVSLSSSRAGGTVSVQLPGTTTFVPLRESASIPVGSVVDATAGSVSVSAASGGKIVDATVAAGIFRLVQAKNAIPTLALVTPAGKANACASRTTPRKGVIRSLSVVAKGVFRTVAAKGVAVIGARASWTTSDRCDGTITKVKKGRVTLTAGHTTKRLRAGQSYLAKARLFGALDRA